VIVRTGAGVRHWSAGDRVVVFPGVIDPGDPASQDDGLLAAEPLAWGYETNFGGMAEFTIVKANQLIRKPECLTWEEAAAHTLCAGTAYRMLVGSHGARTKQGDVDADLGRDRRPGPSAVPACRSAGEPDALPPMAAAERLGAAGPVGTRGRRRRRRRPADARRRAIG
jgi:crotonyl-CoA reductase